MSGNKLAIGAWVELLEDVYREKEDNLQVLQISKTILWKSKKKKKEKKKTSIYILLRRYVGNYTRQGREALVYIVHVLNGAN